MTVQQSIGIVMELQERIAGHLAANKFGRSAREVSKAIGEKLDIVQENLLVMAAMGTVKHRQVGRDQVYMLADSKAPLPAPREIAPGSWTQPAPVMKVQPVADATVVEPKPRPVPVAGPTLVEQPRKPQPVAGPTIVEPASRLGPVVRVLDAKPRRQASLYAHVGGSITLNVFGKPVTARFTSVEQLKKFVDDLVEAGRAPEKG